MNDLVEQIKKRLSENQPVDEDYIYSLCLESDLDISQIQDVVDEIFKASSNVLTSTKELNILLPQVIKDIEENSKKFGCYAYPKTIRSIINGVEKSAVAHHFSNKPYFGVYKDDKLSLNSIEIALEDLVLTHIIFKKNVNGKTRYTSKEIKELRNVADDECPNCGEKLIKKISKYGTEFLVCSGYPKCKYIKNEKNKYPIETEEICPNCGSPVILKLGRFGEFKACSNYPKCKTILK